MCNLAINIIWKKIIKKKLIITVSILHFLLISFLLSISLATHEVIERVFILQSWIWKGKKKKTRDKSNLTYFVGDKQLFTQNRIHVSNLE
jgi:hypothetical protein